MGLEALLDTQILSVVGNTGDILELQSDGTYAPVAPTGGGIGGSTGSVDNVILRADGTGGATLQDSAWIIADNYTASPNNTVNHASIQATGGSTNVSVSIVPKGSGAFSLKVPDSTTNGGNVRGANAIDLQIATLGNAANVASGTGSALLAGDGQSIASGNYSLAAAGGRATGAYAVAFGRREVARSLASGSNAVAISGGTASGIDSFAGGFETTNSGSYGTFAFGDGVTVSAGRGATAFGDKAVANRQGMFAFAAGRFSANGDCQFVRFVLRNKTTTNSAVTLFIDGSSTRLTVSSGKILYGTLNVIGSKSDGTAIASYMRQVAIANVGGTTALVGTVNTIGVDEAAGTSLAVTADNTNDAIDIQVTGISAETWRWGAVFDGIEMAYGS